jgi:hypothetical protein
LGIQHKFIGFGGLLYVNSEFAKVKADSNEIRLAIAEITGCIFYNVLNFQYLRTIGLLTIFIYCKLNQMNDSETKLSAYFQSISKLETNLGWWGFATNIAFNI